MGEAAAAVDPAEVETPPPSSDEQEPFIFDMGEEEPKPEEPAKDTPAEPAENKEVESLKAEIESLKKNAENEKASYWRKQYFLEKEKRDKEATAEPKAKFSDGQLLKILEEHAGEPAVLLQVMKHLTDGKAEEVEKKAAESAEIRQQKKVAEDWVRTNAPQVYDEGSEMHQQHQAVKAQMHLEDHPLGDFLALAAGQMASYQENLKKAIEQAREDERKKVLSEMNQTTRKGAIKGAAPAGGKSSPAAGAASEAAYYAQAKAMGLSGSEAKEYVKIRKLATKSKMVMEG